MTAMVHIRGTNFQYIWINRWAMRREILYKAKQAAHWDATPPPPHTQPLQKIDHQKRLTGRLFEGKFEIKCTPELLFLNSFVLRESEIFMGRVEGGSSFWKAGRPKAICFIPIKTKRESWTLKLGIVWREESKGRAYDNSKTHRCSRLSDICY